MCPGLKGHTSPARWPGASRGGCQLAFWGGATQRRQLHPPPHSLLMQASQLAALHASGASCARARSRILNLQVHGAVRPRLIWQSLQKPCTTSAWAPGTGAVVGCCTVAPGRCRLLSRKATMMRKQLDWTNPRWTFLSLGRSKFSVPAALTCFSDCTHPLAHRRCLTPCSPPPSPHCAHPLITPKRRQQAGWLQQVGYTIEGK